MARRNVTSDVENENDRDTDPVTIDRAGLIRGASTLIFFKPNIGIWRVGIDENEVDQKQLLYAISKAQMSEVIEDLPNGLITNLGENGFKLSGGQRQRIALARAFYFNRSVLVLDEATSSLDIRIEKNIIDYLKNLKSKVTIISITHRLQSLEHSDQIFQISNGKLSKYNGKLTEFKY